MENKYSCNVIKDLLPLYQDEICSTESRQMVEEHLAECGACRLVAKQLENNNVESKLMGEKQGVLKQHAMAEKKRTTTIGMITAGILMIPTIVCLICNLAVGHALDWFFIVLVSLLVFASVTVVPMVMDKNKVLWTIGSFTISVSALLGVINLYTHGNWFFISVVPTLFGLTVVLLPIVLYRINLPKGIQNQKGLICMTVDTLFLFGLLFVCGLYYPSASYNRIAYGITAVSAAFIWLCFLVIRYLKVSGMRRAGIVTILTGLFTPFVNGMTDFFINGTWTTPDALPNLFHWTLMNLEANIYVIITAICLIVGVWLIINGKKKKEEGIQ